MSSIVGWRKRKVSELEDRTIKMTQYDQEREDKLRGKKCTEAQGYVGL